MSGPVQVRWIMLRSNCVKVMKMQVKTSPQPPHQLNIASACPLWLQISFYLRTASLLTLATLWCRSTQGASTA